MATVKDASGNTPQADSDIHNGGHYDLSLLSFEGNVYNVTLGASAVLSGPFSRLCSAIRIAPEGNCNYKIGDASVVAVKGTDQFLAANAVELIRVKGGQYISIIQDATETDNVNVRENKS